MEPRAVEWHADPEAVYEYEAELYPDLLDTEHLPMLIGYPVSINGVAIDDAIMYTIDGSELFISSVEELPNFGMIVDIIYETERDDDNDQYHHRFKEPLIILEYLSPGDALSYDDDSDLTREAEHYHIFINKVTIDPERGFLD